MSAEELEGIMARANRWGDADWKALVSEALMLWEVRAWLDRVTSQGLDVTISRAVGEGENGAYYVAWGEKMGHFRSSEDSAWDALVKAATA